MPGWNDLFAPEKYIWQCLERVLQCRRHPLETIGSFIWTSLIPLNPNDIFFLTVPNVSESDEIMIKQTDSSSVTLSFNAVKLLKDNLYGFVCLFGVFRLVENFSPTWRHHHYQFTKFDLYLTFMAIEHMVTPYNCHWIEPRSPACEANAVLLRHRSSLFAWKNRRVLKLDFTIFLYFFFCFFLIRFWLAWHATYTILLYCFYVPYQYHTPQPQFRSYAF